MDAIAVYIGMLELGSVPVVDMSGPNPATRRRPWSSVDMQWQTMEALAGVKSDLACEVSWSTRKAWGGYFQLQGTKNICLVL